MARIKANNIDIHYQLSGKGKKTVVFNHGLVMDNLSSWYFTLGNRVAEFASSLMYDLRGHGRTERSPAGYSIENLVKDLSELLKRLEISEPVYLVGNSFGGVLNIAFALKYPERTAGIVLIDSHIGDKGFVSKMTGTLSLRGEERDRAIASSFKAWLGRHSSRKRNRLAENAEKLVYGTSLIEDIQSSGIIMEEDLAGIKSPVLAIYGENSDIRKKGEKLSSLLPFCEYRVIKGSTHSVIWEATEELIRYVTAWLRHR